MNKNIIIGIVVVVALIGGYAIYKNSNTLDYSYEQPPVTTPSPAPISETPAPSSAPSVKEFTVTGGNFYFSPSSISVKKGDTVKITFKNGGGTHDLRVDGYGVGTKVMGTAGQETVTFVADKTGSFEYYCSVGTHRQMGMRGTLTVTD